MKLNNFIYRFAAKTEEEKRRLSYCGTVIIKQK